MRIRFTGQKKPVIVLDPNPKHWVLYLCVVFVLFNSTFVMLYRISNYMYRNTVLGPLHNVKCLQQAKHLPCNFDKLFNPVSNAEKIKSDPVYWTKKTLIVLDPDPKHWVLYLCVVFVLFNSTFVMLYRISNYMYRNTVLGPLHNVKCLQQAKHLPCNFDKLFNPVSNAEKIKSDPVYWTKKTRIVLDPNPKHWVRYLCVVLMWV